MSKGSKHNPNEPTVSNRKARHKYLIQETLEVGIKLVGTEIKAVRDGKISLAEGYVRAVESPLSLTIHGIHIGEYPPAGTQRQHNPTAVRVLLAHKREIRKLVTRTRAKGTTIVPLKLYFVRGRAKLLIGIGLGKRKADKRQALAAQDSKREMDRALSRKA